MSELTKARELNKTHRLYVMLSMTGTIPSHILRNRMKGTYSHVSISLDKNLHHMYSFGRLVKWLIVPGGMVHEIPSRNVYSRFKHTKCAIYEVPVTKEQYEKARSLIKRAWKKRRKLKYNFPGIFAANFCVYPTIPNSYYCTQFVARILTESGICFTKKNYRETVIDDFRNAEGFRLIYEGELRDYWNGCCTGKGYQSY